MDEKKIYQQLEFRYNEIITKFKNLSYIALALILMGIVLLFTFVFSYLKPGLGICVFLFFVTGGILVELINGNLTWLEITKAQSELTSKGIAAEAEGYANVYRYSFIIYAAAIIAGVYLLPLFNNFNYTLTQYYGFLPLLTTLSIFMVFILRSISHLYLKNSNLYQQAGIPLKHFSKKALLLPIILFIVTFDSYIIMVLLVPIVVGFTALIFCYYGILYLAGHRR